MCYCINKWLSLDPVFIFHDQVLGIHFEPDNSFTSLQTHTHTKTPYSKHQKDKKTNLTSLSTSQLFTSPWTKKIYIYIFQKQNSKRKFYLYLHYLFFFSCYNVLSIIDYSVRILLLQYLAWTSSFNLVSLYITLNINIP